MPKGGLQRWSVGPNRQNNQTLQRSTPLKAE
jgi:hypothetical protein